MENNSKFLKWISFYAPCRPHNQQFHGAILLQSYYITVRHQSMYHVRFVILVDSWQPIHGQPVHRQVVRGQPIHGQPVRGQVVRGQCRASWMVPELLMHEFNCMQVKVSRKSNNTKSIPMDIIMSNITEMNILTVATILTEKISVKFCRYHCDKWFLTC